MSHKTCDYVDYGFRVICYKSQDDEISIRLFVCRTKTQKFFDQFASNFDWETWKNYGNVFSLVYEFLNFVY